MYHIMIYWNDHAEIKWEDDLADWRDFVYFVYYRNSECHYTGSKYQVCRIIEDDVAFHPQEQHLVDQIKFFHCKKIWYYSVHTSIFEAHVCMQVHVQLCTPVPGTLLTLNWLCTSNEYHCMVTNSECKHQIFVTVVYSEI